MKTVYAVPGGRAWPRHLQRYFETRVAVQPLPASPQLPRDAVLILLAPAWHEGRYLATEAIWKRHFETEAPQSKLILTGFSRATNQNYLDLLALPDNWDKWCAQARTCGEDWQPAPSGGLDLEDKLRRFFAGHGDNSIIALLTRLHLLVQLAQREVVQYGTPYAEVYAEVVEPAQPARKWAEWRNRWENYVPYFSLLPFADQLRQVDAQIRQLGPWLEAGARDVAPILNGKVPEILHEIKIKLLALEQRYVAQKL